MVAAYLQGLLKPTLRHGLRSRMSEEIIIEAMAASNTAGSMRDGMSLDAAMLPVLTEKGIRGIIEGFGKRLTRANELRTYDIYKIADQLADNLKIANKQQDLSVFQLYQIAEKGGIFESLRKHQSKQKWTKLL